MKKTHSAIETLLSFAVKNQLIEREDVVYSRNYLLDALGLTQPGDDSEIMPMPATATPLLDVLCAHAAQEGIIPSEPVYRDLFGARLMGFLTPRPSEITNQFQKIYTQQDAAAATDWFYRLCRNNDYIRVDAIANNVIFEQDSPVGELTITINLSKPEKDPRQIALERAQPAAGYPSCMLCLENIGYAGRVNYPARQNHRAIPLHLGGKPWHMQYSPYLYYPEHCIVFSDTHEPMQVCPESLSRMFDFVEQFPHYFIGSNADLPIVGGSILSHDHFQGGRHVFPMMKAPLTRALSAPVDGIQAGIVNWPLSTLRLSSTDRHALLHQATCILGAWREYSDERHGIYAHTDAPHNTITPTLRYEGGRFILDLVLRNNRTSAEHALGIYHPHAELHHIKRENIGLIEVMGLFILPGRLKDELETVKDALIHGKLPTGEAMEKHLPWIGQMLAKYKNLSLDDAEKIIRRELADKCANVLIDCGVFPQTEDGVAGMTQFLSTVGYTAK